MLTLLTAIEASSSYPKTSLEIVFTWAFNQGVENGDWNRIFGGQEGIRDGSFCTGAPENWQIPDDSSDLASDLTRVVERGTFRCGYIRNLDEGAVIRAGNTSESVSGAIPDWWDALAGYVSGTLQDSPPIAIEWMLYDSAQEVLDAVHSGEADAACGQWVSSLPYIEM